MLLLRDVLHATRLEQRWLEKVDCAVRVPRLTLCAMLARVCSAAVNGIDAYPVEVEVNAGWGDTVIVIVGLPDAAVKESRDRVMTAIHNSGYKFAFGRTTINLDRKSVV